MLTKEMMQKMKEDELSRKVIIPLLREMGFHDVHYYGGGSGELGKDVVCWKPDELDARRNYVMVIKAINITGQAKSVKGSAGEVATQVQQAFGSTFMDTVTTEPQDVHVCWIITNKQINKEAKQAIKSILKAANLDRHIRFVDGGELWGYVEKHMASETLMGKFQKIQKELSSIDTHYRPIIKISGDQIFIGVEEKYKGAAEEKPLKFDLAFQFPDTPEGQAAKFALQQHHATGAPASISSEFIQSIQYPELIKALFGTDVPESSTIELASIPSDHHFIAQMEIVCDDGDRFNLDYIDLCVIQSGTEEATLESVEPGSLIRLKLVVKFAEQAAKLTFRFGLPGESYSCTQLLQVTEFQNCFSKPFNFKLLSKETGLEVFSQRSEQGIFSAPPKFHLEMYKVLDRLQQKSKQLIMVPRRVLTDEEIKDINELLHIVRHGRIQGTWTEFSFKLMNFSEDAFNQLSTDPFWFRLEAQEEMSIFGVKLPLGVSEQLFRNGLFANLDEIRKAYQSGKRDIFAHVVAKDGSGECEKIYHDFAKKADNEHTF